MTKKYVYELAVAGLIHDIGKLYQKTSKSPLYRKSSVEHPLIARDFIQKFRGVFSQVFSTSEIEFICECAVRHHTGQNFGDEVNPNKAIPELKKYCNIISVADNISSSERKGTSGIHGKKECAVMNPILTYDDKSIKCKEHDYYALTKYSDYNLKITSGKVIGKDEVVYLTDDAYLKFIDAFEKDMGKIEAKDKKEFFEKLLFVIKDYTWCVPSNAADLVHDISLYQHLVTTSGIAIALYGNLDLSDNEDFANNFAEKSKNNWTILNLKMDKADEYILDTMSYGSDILNEIATNNANALSVINTLVENILEKFELVQSNILMQNNSFDKYIIVPRTVCNELKNYITEYNKTIFSSYNSKLLVSYGFVDVLDDEIKIGSFFRPKVDYTQGITSVLSSNGEWNYSNCIIKQTNNMGVKKVIDTELLNTIVGDTNKYAIAVIDADKVIETMLNGFGNKDTISRIATYSSIVSDFFSEVIGNLFEDGIVININANRVIVVYNSDFVLENIETIMGTFSEYINNRVTLSVAIKLVSLKARLFSLSDLFNDKLVNLKQLGGNRVFYSDLIMQFSTNPKLNEVSKYIDMVCMLVDTVEVNETPKSVLHKLQIYGQKYQSWVDEDNYKGLMFYSNYLGNPKKFKECSEELKSFLTEHITNICKNPVEDKEKDIVDKEFYMLKSAAYDSELRVRGNEINGK